MSLKDWFGKGPKGDWVRMDTKGKIKGPCAREEGEGKPKCLPRSKAQAMSKKDRASAARRKRREDPVADRVGKGGKPIMVKTKKEEVEYITEKSKPTNPALWSRAKAAARAKFDVYPSAYANGWAVRWYKKRGGGWRTVKEENEFKPHYMYKDDKKVMAKKPEDHDRLKKMGYSHDDPETKKVEEGKQIDESYTIHGEFPHKHGGWVRLLKRSNTDPQEKNKKIWQVHHHNQRVVGMDRNRIVKTSNKSKTHVHGSYEGHAKRVYNELKKKHAMSHSDAKKHYPQYDHSQWHKGPVKENTVNEKCWDGYTQAGMKKKGKKVVPNCVPESESLGTMVARMQQKQQARDWNKKSQAEKLADLKKNRDELKKRMEEVEQVNEVDLRKMDHDTFMKYGDKNPKGRADLDWNAERKRRYRNAQSKNYRKLKKRMEEIDMTGCPLLEKLSPSDGIGTYIKDFKKSDAPQFKGASASKRRKMAVAAYLGAKRKKMEESMKYDSSMGVMDWGTPKGTEYMKSNTPGESMETCSSCNGAGCSHCDYRGTHTKKIKEAKEMSKRDPVAKNMNKFNKPATHRDRKNDYSRKNKHKGKMYEETEAGETKKKYREDNAELAPEAGIVPLNDKDIRALEHEVQHFNWQIAIDLDLYDDDELMDDIDSTDPHDEVEITEVLSVQGRLKRKFAARKNRQKLKVARNIALRRGSTPDRLKKRATRGARGLVYKRLLRGRSKTNMPPAEKARLEKMLQLYAPLVQRLSVRLLPNMRKMEISRMKNRKGSAAKKSKKYKAARPVAKKQTAKKFKIKK